MVGDTWIIRWREVLSNSYAAGSVIKVNTDNTIYYENRLMPPGNVIHTWFSKTNYQGNRIEPMLPLIDGEAAYSLTINIDCFGEGKGKPILRVVFLDRYDVEFDSIILRDEKSIFKPPITTYSYKIELINGGVSEFVFESLILQEVSKDEFEAYREHFEKNKKYRKKRKKKRGAVQKSK